MFSFYILPVRLVDQSVPYTHVAVSVHRRGLRCIISTARTRSRAYPIDQFRDRSPYKDAILSVLRAAVLFFSEDYVSSRVAVSRDEYVRLRLTGCALLSTTDAQFHLLTVDLDLYLAFLRAARPVTNFRHVIDNRP